MATQTTNYGLTKPDSTDNFSAFRQLFNDNMDIIDANLGGGEETTDLFSILDTVRVDARYSVAAIANHEFTFSMEESDNQWSATATATNDTAVVLTDIDKLRIVVDITDRADYGYFWVTLSQTKYTWDSYTWPGCYMNVNSALRIDSSGTYEIDVSLLSGNYYIYIGGTTGKDSTTAGNCNNSHNGKIVGKVTDFLGVSEESSSSVVANPTGTPTDELLTVEIDNVIYSIPGGGGGSADISNIVHEVIHQDNVSISDNAQITLNLTNKYTDPFVFPTNSLPLTSWGGLIVVQDSTVVYDSANDTLTFKVYVNSGQNYNVDWVVMDKEASNGSGKGSDQIIDISSFTKIYDNTVPFGNYGAKIDSNLDLVNESMIAYNMSLGWDSAKSSYYDSEYQIGAYGGYQFNAGIKLNRVRFYIGRYSGQNLDLTVTAQYLDSSNVWHDVDDMVISTSINYPICSFDVDFSSLEKVYGVRWYHYKNPEKSPSNNICFFGMIMYKAASVEGGGSSEIEYSTTEKKIGKWIDGKNLYQITLTGTGSNRIDISSLGIDTFCGVDAGGTYIIRQDTQQTLFLDSTNPQGSNYGWIMAVNSAKTEIEIVKSAYNIADYVFTIRYTKTADTAGSGN